jgi:hypothetical protein
MEDVIFRSKLADTVFIVEANSYEHLALWRESALQADRPDIAAPVDWRQDNEGRFVELGKLDGMPVTLSLRWDIIDGCRVLFIDCPSVVQDWRMVDAWLEQNCNPPKWDGGSRPARCDAMNFHHCLDAIRERRRNILGDQP